MKLALSQGNSEELIPSQDLCSGVTAVDHPVTQKRLVVTSKAPSIIQSYI